MGRTGAGRCIAVALLAGTSAMPAPAGDVPDDPFFPQQWHLHNDGKDGRRVDADIDAPEAWAITRGSPDIIIAVLDDGVQLDHPDLAANLHAVGRDFTVDPPRPDGGPRDTADRHGTAVAGVAAARGDNGLGVSGVCPRCSILPIRVDGKSSLGTAAAFRYAAEQGASIITNSWGYTRDAAGADDTDAVRNAIESAATDGRDGRGAVVVFGVTNDSVDNCSGPHADISSLESVLAVGVSNHDDEVGGAGFGACLDLVAPAKPRDVSTIGIVTTDRTGIDGHTADDYYSSFGGTSAAAPIVAGAAGLLLSLNPRLTRVDVQRILEHTADKIDPEHAAYDARGFSVRAGYGRVNAARALVPYVTIAVTPSRVAVGETFTVTVTASAPFGIESLWWFGMATGQAAIDAPHTADPGGRAVHTATWTGLSMTAPGTFVLGADARDTRHDDPLPRYPHRASASGPALAEVTVVERRDGVSR